MNDGPNILFIVEGAKLEPKIVERMISVYKVNCEITSVCTNIHALYQILKKDDGFSDIISVLKELFIAEIKKLESDGPKKDQRKQLNRVKADLEKLNGKFAYRYLVFDSELQHGEGGVSLPREKQIEINCNKLKNMLEFFNNESDQGKLYVNYPMMESYRDCDAFFDEGYKDRTVALDLLSKYKEQVGKRKLSKVHTDKIDKEDFDQLIRMNVFKLNRISTENWMPMSYDDFLLYSEQQSILSAEQNFMAKEKAIAVLNTLLFFTLDYYGRNFYTTMMKCG